MRNISGKIFGEIQNAHLMAQESFFFPEFCTLYEMIWKTFGTARQATDENTILLMRFACWEPKATYIDSEYVIFIVFPPE